jgi:hypothetical protein
MPVFILTFLLHRESDSDLGEDSALHYLLLPSNQKLKYKSRARRARGKDIYVR